MWNPRLYEAEAGIKTARRNINNLSYEDHTTLLAKSEEELKSLFMRVKEESEKAGLKFNIQKSKIMASGFITSLQIVGKKIEAMTDSIFLGSKIIVDCDCSHEIKRWLLLGRKCMINLDSVLKSRDITLLTNVGIVSSIVFPVVMYSCESCTKRRQSTKELMPSNCGAGEDSWKFLEHQGDQVSQSLEKSTLNTHWKDWCWSSSIWVIWCK